ncbi:MAG: 50S ribosomal protein L17 [Firmicutes bacterium]|nr:50S ribosomal protein L17 [Bacillota bacterium]
MRHRQLSVRLGRQTGHRQALLRNLATSLFVHGRITTTETKAKELCRFASKLITLAKKGDLSSRRRVLEDIQNKEVTKKLFEIIAVQYQNRQPADSGGKGGYIRIVKGLPRKGDGAPAAIVELV